MSKQDMKIFSILAILIVAFVAIGAVSAAEVPTDVNVDDASTTSPVVGTDGGISGGSVSGNVTVAETTQGAGTTDVAHTYTKDDVAVSVGSSSDPSGAVAGTKNGTTTALTGNLIDVYIYNTEANATTNGKTVDTGLLSSITTALNDKGAYAFNFDSITSTKFAAGTTYWLNITFAGANPAGGVSGVTAADSYSAANTVTSFTTAPAADVSLAADNLTFGDDWVATGSIADISRTDLVSAGIVQGTGESGDIFVPGSNHAILTVINETYRGYYDLLPYVKDDGSIDIAGLMNAYYSKANAGQYTLILTYTGNGTIAAPTAPTISTNTTKVTIGKQNASIANYTANATNVTYPEDVSISGVIVDASGKVIDVTGDDKVIVNIIGDNGVTVDKATVSLTNGKFNITSLKTLLGADYNVGNYYITLANGTAPLANYDIAYPETLTITVNMGKDNLTVNSTEDVSTTNPVYVNMTNSVVGTYVYVLKDSTGKVIQTGTGNYNTPDTLQQIAIGELSKGDYTCTVTFTPDNSNIAGSSETVDVTIRDATTMGITNYTSAASVVGTTINFNYPINSSNSTKFNVTLNGNKNTTVSVVVDGKVVANVTTVNGTATIDLADYNMAPGLHNVIFAYAGDDDNAPVNAYFDVKVIGLPGYANINTSNVVLNLTNNPTVNLNLTSDKNGNNLINYTGKVNVIDDEDIVIATLDMVNGTVTFNVKDLGLLDNTTVTFQAGNYDDTADLVVNITTVNPEINTIDNVSATADSVVVTVPINNTEDGAIVIGYLIDTNGKRVAAIGTIVNGSAVFDFGAQATGNYVVLVEYKGYAYTDDNISEVGVVNVTAAPSVNATVITADNMTLAPSSGVNFTAVLKDANGNVISGKEVQLTLFNALGESKVYWATTNTNGEAKLPINLAYNGTYTIECYFPGDNTTVPSNKYNATVVIGNVTPVTNATIMTASDLNTTNRSGVNYTAKLTYANGTAVSGAEVKLVLKNALNQTVTYDRTTNADGEAKLPIELAYPATYTIECYYDGSASIPASNHSTGTIIITALA